MYEDHVKTLYLWIYSVNWFLVMRACGRSILEILIVWRLYLLEWTRRLDGSSEIYSPAWRIVELFRHTLLTSSTHAPIMNSTDITRSVLSHESAGYPSWCRPEHTPYVSQVYFEKIRIRPVIHVYWKNGLYLLWMDTKEWPLARFLTSPYKFN